MPTVGRLAQAVACCTFALLVIISYYYYDKAKTLTYDNRELSNELVLTRKSRDLALDINTAAQAASLRNEKLQVANKKEHDVYRTQLDSNEADLLPLSSNYISIMCKVYRSTSGVCLSTNVPTGGNRTSN